jgi:hypothetical protein
MQPTYTRANLCQVHNPASLLIWSVFLGSCGYLDFIARNKYKSSMNTLNLMKEKYVAGIESDLKASKRIP